jgi:hypothetical protein
MSLAADVNLAEGLCLHDDDDDNNNSNNNNNNDDDDVSIRDSSVCTMMGSNTHKLPYLLCSGRGWVHDAQASRGASTSLVLLALVRQLIL